MCCFLTLLMLWGYMDRMREDMLCYIWFFFSFNYKSRYVKHVLYPHTHTHMTLTINVSILSHPVLFLKYIGRGRDEW